MVNSEIPGASDPGKLMGGALSGLKSTIQGLEAKRAESLPKWWKTWREMSGKGQS